MSDLSDIDDFFDFSKPYERVYVSGGLTTEYNIHVVKCIANGTKVPTLQEFQEERQAKAKNKKN